MHSFVFLDGVGIAIPFTSSQAFALSRKQRTHDLLYTGLGMLTQRRSGVALIRLGEIHIRVARDGTLVLEIAGDKFK